MGKKVFIIFCLLSIDSCKNAVASNSNSPTISNSAYQVKVPRVPSAETKGSYLRSFPRDQKDLLDEETVVNFGNQNLLKDSSEVHDLRPSRVLHVPRIVHSLHDKKTEIQNPNDLGESEIVDSRADEQSFEGFDYDSENSSTVSSSVKDPSLYLSKDYSSLSSDGERISPGMIDDTEDDLELILDRVQERLKIDGLRSKIYTARLNYLKNNVLVKREQFVLIEHKIKMLESALRLGKISADKFSEKLDELELFYHEALKD